MVEGSQLSNWEETWVKLPGRWGRRCFLPSLCNGIGTDMCPFAAGAGLGWAGSCLDCVLPAGDCLDLWAREKLDGFLLGG